jgi:dethiobiotin synthetase
MSKLALGLFVTGTDTGVGKTFVTAAVARILRQRGHGVVVCKPVATGAEWINGHWVSDDTVALARAAGVVGDWSLVTPWSFPDPVAPPVAVRRAGVELTLHQIIRAVQERLQPQKAMLIEGIGGLLCPLTEKETVADLVAALKLPLVVVTRRSLGTLNHTLLTLEVAQKRNLTVAGVIIDETSPPQTLAEETNVLELQKRMQEPLLATVPFQAGPLDSVPASLEAVDWWRLCQVRG